MIRWSHAEPAAKIEVAWRLLRSLPADQQLQKISEHQPGAVFWMIQAAYEIELELDDVFGRGGFTAEQVRKILGEYNSQLRTVVDIRRAIMDFNKSDSSAWDEDTKEMFPHLFDQDSTEFRRFDDFLNRVCDPALAPASRN